jgi:cyclin B
MQKNIYIIKISEVNIKLDDEIIQNNNLKLKSEELSNINNNYLLNDKIKNKYDLQFAEEYQEEIIPYLISLEYKKRINPNYMLNQNDINEKMRMILIDWLIEVHLKFKLLPETLFLTINFIDRYLQNNQTKRDKLQLIAVSSLLIACKYEEIYPPEISSFVYITDNAYKKEDILNYEIKILEDLEYDLTYPSIHRYFELVALKLNLQNDKTFYNKMMCLSELCLSKLIFYNFTYLELVLACALFLFEKNLFMTQCVIRHFGLGENYQKLEKINNCIFEIKKLLEYMNENKNIFKGVRQKYALEKYGCISMNEFL